MSEATASATLHNFCKRFASELFDEHVHLPAGTDQDRAMEQFHRLGFTGAVGSTNSVHLRWGMCPYNLVSAYTGKEEFPTIAYQVSVDHSGRCLGATGGFTGATDVKEIMRHDAAVKEVRENPAYKDRVFRLRKADGSWEERKGCYLLAGESNHEVGESLSGLLLLLLLLFLSSSLSFMYEDRCVGIVGHVKQQTH